MVVYPFNLQEKEKVLKDITPEEGLKTYFTILYLPVLFFASIFLSVFGFVFGGFVFLIFMRSPGAILGSAALAFIGFILFIVLGSIFLAHMAYEKRHYWITNKRVVVKRGLIGYSISSIPLERISDVIISKSFLENLAGVTSLHIQTLAGQQSYYSGSYRLGSEGDMLGVSEPEKLQELIFKQIKEKRKRERITF